jgi:hypothetical protein
MTDAYKCDRCDEYREGSPCRRKYRSYASRGITGWTDSTTKSKAELCPECAETADQEVAELFEGEI